MSFTNNSSSPSLEPSRELVELFKSGAIFEMDDNELMEVLKQIPQGSYDTNYSSYIVSTLIINAIQNRRHIDKIEFRNQVYTWLIIGLSITAIVVQLAPLFIN